MVHLKGEAGVIFFLKSHLNVFHLSPPSGLIQTSGGAVAGEEPQSSIGDCRFAHRQHGAER